MFKLPAILFAIFIGFFMSLTLTICLSFYMTGFNNSLLTKFFQLWPIAYPIAIISIIIYRPLSLWIAGKALTKLSSKNSKE
jgi:membrane protein implicated in regulation of membrane protease activity